MDRLIKALDVVARCTEIALTMILIAVAMGMYRIFVAPLPPAK